MTSPSLAVRFPSLARPFTFSAVLEFRYPVVLTFAVLEVLVFSAAPPVQTAVALIEYGFVALSLLHDRRQGILYLLAFTLLAVGEWSHVGAAAPSYTFWGLRAGGLSLNILFTAAAWVFVLATSDIRYRFAPFGLDSHFLNGFIGYATLLGLGAVVAGVNHFDNFLGDALTYVPYVLYVYLVAALDRRDVATLFRFGMSATILAMLLSYLTGVSFTYASQHKFVLMNSFAYVAPFAIIFLRPLYERWHYVVLVTIVIGLFAVGAIFTGGKTLVLLAMTVAWAAYRSRRGLLIIAVAAGLIVLFLEPLVAVASIFNDRVLFAYKLSQIVDVFVIPDLWLLAATPTSMGNLVAEGVTVVRYLVEQPLALVFGKGFGGGTPDLYGFLAPLAMPGYGYSVQDALRDDFVRMHMPVFEIALKAGVVGCAAYIGLLLRRVLARDIFSYIYFVLLFTVFYVSKEMLLLTLVCLALVPREAKVSSRP